MGIRNRLRQLVKREEGQAITEFAIVLPVMILLITGILVFGHMMYAKTLVVLSASQGARVGGAVWDDEGAGAARAKIRNTALSILTNGLSGSHDVQIRETGNDISVTVTYDYPVTIPIISAFFSNPVVKLEHTAVYKVL
ncbi:MULTISPECIES: TadE/TadG family type IV pilus assembly protein [Brevibacillus]|uniref:TadE family protein n=1 Tax=Brevibacillus borstelensis AK1 TaxID=1300222 RepID=M8D9C7_9BACL|nr:TadE family protein [Brevibacillus borstelensis]EMT49963.1 TadE family protein [Brevibacillus borstelensis AK1]MBE5393895.1 pilus assembly protein [Brevibacillus borstelensis]MCC0565828.1 pilus assembly protein [Brevibacillus borstelensis]MCM3472100.1 pilus assembly protein [Brevibacillus borstelensis]MCM3560703.1 pilus assembly protein [Brevibacillus borstelensis]